MYKSSEEIRTELALNQTKFSENIGLSRRTYNARLMNEQDWKLPELIQLAEMSKGKVSVKCGQDTYLISIKKLEKDI